MVARKGLGEKRATTIRVEERNEINKPLEGVFDYVSDVAYSPIKLEGWPSSRWENCVTAKT